MVDIVEKLKERRSIDGSVVYVEMSEQVLDDAIYEIERLRATIANLQLIAGKASIDGQTMATIKRENPILGKWNGAPNG